MDVRDIGWVRTGIHLAQDRGQWPGILNVIMNLEVP
jgi:hypothetical protein